ncbi:MAG: hypothetical protein LBS09_07875 [Bacteroidales bacterium]|jgi:cell division protein FtsB|nr:hypothetical protein [Bacteroidales bacterium]
MKKIIFFFLPLLKNKYTLSLMVFFAWIVFFDSNNLINRAIRLKQVHRLEKEKIYYEQKIAEDHEKLDELTGNPEKLEKFAREQYLMKRANEDIFIIEK